MARQIHFTKAALEKLKTPLTGRVLYRDDEITSLELAVFQSGKKTFYLYKRIGSSPTRIKLGVFPDISVENARREAQKKLGEIAKGENPADKKRKLRSEITFGQLFEIYLKKHAKHHKKSWQLDQDIYDRHLKKRFENSKLSLLTAEKIRDMHSKLSEAGKPMANRVLALVSSVLGKATEWDLYEGANPANKIKKFIMHSRDRFLLPEEMPKFFEALEKEENKEAKDYILMSLYTGARKSNVLSMRWDELFLKADKPYWRIPSDKSKNDDFMMIPLSRQAVEILEIRRHSKKSGSEYVFPSTGKAGHLADPKKAWRRVLKRAGIEDLRLHDLRRTLGSWLASSGANSFMIGKALGHKSIKSTAIYARLNIDPVAASIDIATNAMVKASKGSKAK